MLSITQGDNKLVSPYTGADPMQITLTGGKSNSWYELIVPTGILSTVQNGVELLSQHWGGEANDPTSGWRQTDSDGNASFLFNASLQDDIVERTQQYGWIIPPGFYPFSVREFYNTVPLETIDIEITSEATTAIMTATATVKKGKGKNR